MLHTSIMMMTNDDDQNALSLKLQIATDLFVYCICLFM